MRIDRRALVGVSASAILATAVPGVARADAKANEEIARRYIDEVWNARNPDAIDDLFAEDYEPPDPRESPGRDAFKSLFTQSITQLTDLIPDLKYLIDSMASKNERVLFRGRITGNAKSGKKIEAMYFDEVLIVDGKIKTEWVLTDDRALLDAF
jgi:predicted SnoaL-like aldol condensation-catalyzing enzyme